MRVLASVTLVALVGACGGARHTYHGGVYRDEETQYRIGELDPSWRALHTAPNVDLAWNQAGTEAVLQVNASCDPSGDVPLVALTNQLLMGFTERDFVEQRLVALDGREALRSHVRAKLDGVVRELAIVVLKKDGCVFDFVLITAPGAAFQTAVPVLDSILSGFSTLGRRV